MLYTEIVKVYGRQIIDSRANPTVEAEVVLGVGVVVVAEVADVQHACSSPRGRRAPTPRLYRVARRSGRGLPRAAGGRACVGC